jgi:hypothetical protein
MTIHINIIVLTESKKGNTVGELKVVKFDLNSKLSTNTFSFGIDDQFEFVSNDTDCTRVDVDSKLLCDEEIEAYGLDLDSESQYDQSASCSRIQSPCLELFSRSGASSPFNDKCTFFQKQVSLPHPLIDMQAPDHLIDEFNVTK